MKLYRQDRPPLFRTQIRPPTSADQQLVYALPYCPNCYTPDLSATLSMRPIRRPIGYAATDVEHIVFPPYALIFSVSMVVILKPLDIVFVEGTEAYLHNWVRIATR